MVLYQRLTDTAAGFRSAALSVRALVFAGSGIKEFCEPEAGSGAPLILLPSESGRGTALRRRTRILNQNEISEQTPSIALLIYRCTNRAFYPRYCLYRHS